MRTEARTSLLAALALVTALPACATWPIVRKLDDRKEEFAERTGVRTPDGIWQLTLRYTRESARTQRWRVDEAARRSVSLEDAGGALPLPVDAEAVEVWMSDNPGAERPDGFQVAYDGRVELFRGGERVGTVVVDEVWSRRRWDPWNLALAAGLPLAIAYDLVTWPVWVAFPQLWEAWWMVMDLSG